MVKITIKEKILTEGASEDVEEAEDACHLYQRSRLERRLCCATNVSSLGLAN